MPRLAVLGIKQVWGRYADWRQRADNDRRLIAYLNPEQRWGTSQANNYDSFLADVMQELADNPASASPCREFKQRSKPNRQMEERQGWPSDFLS